MFTRRQAGVALGLAGVGLALPRGAAAEGNNPIIAGPKVNQVGYLPDAAKLFALTVERGAAPQAFAVEDAARKPVFKGVLGDAVFDETAAGELVRRGDFSALLQAGTYRVRAGNTLSDPFAIGPAVYEPLIRDAARAFWLIRANVAIDDPVTGIAHGMSHPSEAALPDPWGRVRDFTGGWYNAGDFGKWVHMAAMSASLMMWLHELRPARTRDFDLRLSGRDGPLPDLLRLAKWGLEWMLKMQNADGSVLHKVDSQPDFWLGPLEDDPYKRHIMAGGSIDAGVFVGAMLQAVRVFRPFDQALASRGEAAALAAWKWLEANPQVLQDDPYYADTDCREEELWALCEMARHTSDAALFDRVKAEIANRPLTALWWKQPQILGYFSLAVGKNVRADVETLAQTKLAALAEDFVALSRRDGYGVAMKPEEYYWGSVEVVLHRAGALLFAADLFGSRACREAGQRQLDYVLGTNSLSRSFVTGIGARPTLYPHHWTDWVMHKPLPGWASGGPNQYLKGADPLLAELIKRGTPPAKCFVDAPPPHTSWASNEGTTSENAGLLFAAGMAGFER